MARQANNATVGEAIQLPSADYVGGLRFEQALRLRRSVREYATEPITLADLAQLLWAAQGVTGVGVRTIPSAGELYPTQVYAVVGDVTGLDAGVYRYLPSTRSLMPRIKGDLRSGLCGAALNQEWLCNAPAVLVITAEFDRTIKVYGERGNRYVYMEVGHICQNIHLQAASMELGTVIVGAFEDKAVKQLLELAEGESVIAMLPVGHLA